MTMEPIVREKSEYHAKTTANMERFFKVPDWTPQQKVALACRILADEGHESGLAGQLTARGRSPGTFWTLPLGLAFDEAEEASWLLIDDALTVLEGSGSHGSRAPGRPKPGDAPSGGSERSERGGQRLSSMSTS